MGTFHDLPEHLVAIVYSFLPDSTSRHAFFASCRAVHSAPSVLAQITSLVIPPEQVDLGSSRLDYNPLPFFPAGARLSTLRIQGLADDAASKGQHDDGPRLLDLLQPGHKALINLLQPRQETLRMRLQEVMQDVQELILEGVNLVAEAPAAALSRLLCALCPNLKVLKLVKPGPASSTKAASLPASFLPPLADLTLTELHMAKNVNDVHALGQLTSLQALSFSLPLRRSIPLAPLASLSSLKRLTICEDDCMPAGNSLADALAGLRGLGVLHLPCLPNLHELHNLSPSITSLVANHLEGSAESRNMSELLSLAGSGKFPSLKGIHIKELDFSVDRHAQHTFFGVLDRASALLSSVRVTVDEVSAVEDAQHFSNALHTHVDLARGITSIGLRYETIEAGYLQQIAECCPRVTGLHLTMCRMDIGLRPLYEAVDSLPYLQRLCVSMDAFYNTAPALCVRLLAFLVAAASHRPEAPPLYFEMHLVADADMDEALTDEGNCDRYFELLGHVEESWAMVRERLGTKTRPVAFKLLSSNGEDIH